MTNVLLLTIDSLRADRCSEKYFPKSWSILEREFDRFTEAYSHGVATPFAFPGIITGQLPKNDGTLPGTPTLAELCSGKSVAYANNPHLRPDRGYDRGFDEFSYLGGYSGNTLKQRVFHHLGQVEVIKWVYDSINKIVATVNEEQFKEPYRSAMEQVQRVDSALSNDVSFCWAHFQDPHFPFSIESVADGMIRDNFDTEHVRTLNDEYISGDILDDTDSLSKLVEMYDENIRYLDRQLSKLLEKLDKQGWFENGVVAITADHGEVFGESGMTNHPWDALPLDALTQIPLLISTPSNEATIHDQLVQHSDLFRFLAGHLTDDIPSADHRYNLYDDTHRYVVSKSNAVVRCLSSDGSVVNFRDGRMDIDGSPSQSQIEYTKEISFPSIEKSSGTIPGVPDSNHQEIEKRLEALGYVD